MNNSVAKPSVRASEINEFIEALARVELSCNAFNQYSYATSINSIRRHNLLLYFQQMVKVNPQILIVGEAAGYRGCRLTGVPFTSEYILLTGIDELSLFGEFRGYRKTNQSEKIWKEPSASIVWQALVATPQIPLIWNAFPFHSFQFNNQQSNRKPNQGELKIGQVFLKELLQLFNIKIIVAVGNTAEATLKTMDIACNKVRHPSYGGKVLFTNGIKAVMERI